jgi:hypothetical protein
VRGITELIEATEPEHARPLIVLIRRLQIHHARVRDIQRRANDKSGSILLWTNVVGSMIGAAEIHARCGKLFAYSRGDAEAPAAAISVADVQQALSLMPPGLPVMEELEQAIEERRAAVDQQGFRWPET